MSEGDLPDLVSVGTGVARTALPLQDVPHLDGAMLSTDREKSAGTSYYYLRIEQKDGQLAWSSPIWVTWE